MKVRVWKDGKPKDVAGSKAIAAAALLLVLRGVKVGQIKKCDGGYFAPLIKSGKVIGSVVFNSEELELLSALELAGSVRERAERSVKLVVAGKLN